MSRALLEVHDLSAWYGKQQVLFDTNIAVAPGEIVGLFGHNGAGKTSLVRAIVGHDIRGSGQIWIGGKDLGIMGTRGRSVHSAESGVAVVPQGIGVFSSLSVLENIVLGGVAAGISPRSSAMSERVDEVLELFGALRGRLRVRAGSLSGGQRQMVSIARALVLKPKLLMMDEPSVGLAPNLVEQIMSVVRKLADGGLGVLLVEQNLRQALKVVDSVAVMRAGRMIAPPSREEFASGDLWKYF